ncbi:MAG: hypothetical protein JOZ24_07585 [Candidatus Eremiobacteraeota bacterium]|nr:hypothetical protein [Candidatus Eremiobacteraeota bacterium]
MTLDEWARRVDVALRRIEPSLEPHCDDAAWTRAGRSVKVVIAEDDASLRAFFAPRDDDDPAASQPGFTRERIYMRGDADARSAAREVAAFLLFGEIPRPT